MNRERISFLFQRYLDDIATSGELQELEEIIANAEYLEILNEIIDGTYYTIPAQFIADKSGSAAKESAYEFIISQPQHKKIFRLWPRIAAAASVILCLGIGAYFYLHSSPNTNQITRNQKQDVAPGGNRAYLTLANGKRITLTDARNGMLAKQAGVTITKTANGQVEYSISHNNHNSGATDEYNTIETPKGGEYEVKLPDGTDVWLNAASSLKYPASFAAHKERKVELHGEAYFEVAKDKSHPFIVSTAKQEVKVLGTHFNINSYTDEPSTKTTLLEGSVQLNGTTILKPGEQASLSTSGAIDVTEVNVNKAIAWKNGKFVFTSESIESIMRKLARWYNVEVVYEDDFTDQPFTGSISRSDNISKILDKITFTQAVHFKIEGRRITVMK